MAASADPPHASPAPTSPVVAPKDMMSFFQMADPDIFYAEVSRVIGYMGETFVGAMPIDETIYAYLQRYLSLVAQSTDLTYSAKLKAECSLACGWLTRFLYTVEVSHKLQVSAITKLGELFALRSKEAELTGQFKVEKGYQDLLRHDLSLRTERISVLEAKIRHFSTELADEKWQLSEDKKRIGQQDGLLLSLYKESQEVRTRRKELDSQKMILQNERDEGTFSLKQCQGTWRSISDGILGLLCLEKPTTEAEPVLRDAIAAEPISAAPPGSTDIISDEQLMDWVSDDIMDIVTSSPTYANWKIVMYTPPTP